MKKIIHIAVIFAAVISANAEINLVECQKCNKRMRICADGKSANINLARLTDDSPDAATLEKRVASMKARTERLLALGQARPDGNRRSPLMGWSSWNTFAVNISEGIIVETAQAMATNGLKDAGYIYVNIDDGFFYGHGEDGKLRVHPERFPRGLKPVADAIHSLGMKAGIYSDAGADTCGSRYNEDKCGLGSGLYGHDAEDCAYYFGECGFDFIKVDYCGGKWLKLDEKARYTEISEAIRKAGDGKVRFNICRWEYPGTWVTDVADSWRTTRDIRANWKIVNGIIKENLYLSAFSSPGHYNDMDMLEVGHRVGKTKTDFGKQDSGLTEEEETTHFGLWCMLSSPLLIGCDVRAVPPETMALITNPYLIAMNQNNGLGVQGYVVKRESEAYILAKDAFERFGKSRYVALCNLGDEETTLTLNSRDIDLDGAIEVFDLVDKADVGTLNGSVEVRLPPHASKFYLMDAEKRLERTRYEAETAFLTDYQELHDAKIRGTATHADRRGASNGVVVCNLGTRESNDLIWKDVYLMEDGEKRLEFRVISPEARTFYVQIDGGEKIALSAPGGEDITTVSLTTNLTKGIHTIRISNPSAACPDIDCMIL